MSLHNLGDLSSGFQKHPRKKKRSSERFLTSSLVHGNDTPSR